MVSQNSLAAFVFAGKTSRPVVLQAAAGHGQAVPLISPAAYGRAGRAGPEQLDHPPGNGPPRGSPPPPSRQRAAEMAQALLMAGLVEAVVRRPAVVDHGAGLVETQDVRGHIAAAVGSMT